jgi:hypothetical protein
MHLCKSAQLRGEFRDFTELELRLVTSQRSARPDLSGDNALNSWHSHPRVKASGCRSRKLHARYAE